MASAGSAPAPYPHRHDPRRRAATASSWPCSPASAGGAPAPNLGPPCPRPATLVRARGCLRGGPLVVSGGFGAGRGEPARHTLLAGALFVESRVAFEPPPAGARELQGLDPATAAELGEVLAGVRPGRV